MKVISCAETLTSKTHSTDVEAFKLEDGRIINLTGWNGDLWGEWWNDSDPADCGKDARPIYEEILDDDGEGLDQYRIVEILL